MPSGPGPVRAWGWNGLGQLGDGTLVDRTSPVRTAGLADVAALAGGAFHTLAVRSDGTVSSWGWNALGQLGDGSTTDRSAPGPVTGLPPMVSVVAGSYHSLALAGDGTVWAWGWNGVSHSETARRPGAWPP